MADAGFWAVFIVFGVLAIAAFGIILVATRYKRCASDEILVVYGRIRGGNCLLYTSPSPRDAHESRMPSSA